VTAAPRCADWAREVGVDPVGTAGSATGWLLVDWPLPWPRDAADVPALAPVVEALHGTDLRLQLVVPDDGDARDVVLHRCPPGADGWFTSYERIARSVPAAVVVGAALDLVTTGDGDRNGDAVDVLVCGHGARDRCCGSLGATLALEVEGVRRTSHTGGHRFAPTGVVLPAGTSWGYLDHDALRRITAREGPLDDLLPRYRGCAALGSPAAQAAERAAFAEVGWGWLDHGRRAVPAADGAVRIDAIAPDGTERSWEVVVETGRRLPVPDCGRDPAAAEKYESERVVRLPVRAWTSPSAP
jgi:hypothetical protein